MQKRAYKLMATVCEQRRTYLRAHIQVICPDLAHLFCLGSCLVMGDSLHSLYFCTRGPGADFAPQCNPCRLAQQEDLHKACS